MKCLDLFCGIGGLTTGLTRAGVHSVGGIDHWNDAARTFERNHDGVRCLLADIATTSPHQALDFFGVRPSEIDAVVGGPPCQGFSTVGKRDESDPRNRLWEAFFGFVRTIRPSYVVIENVGGLIAADKGGVRNRIIATFREIGYHMECGLVRAADYGVPQLRKRAIFLGWLDGLQPLRLPPPTTLARHVTVAEAIFDLPALLPGESATSYDGPALTDYQRARRGDASVLANHAAAMHPAGLVEILGYIPDGGNRRSIPDRLQPRSGFHNSYARLASNKPAIAVTSNMRKPSSSRTTHPVQPRGLTAREGLRLQSFDDDFVVLGSRTSQYLQIGNAVPPLLGEAIGRELVRACARNSDGVLRTAHMPDDSLMP